MAIVSRQFFFASIVDGLWWLLLVLIAGCCMLYAIACYNSRRFIRNPKFRSLAEQVPHFKSQMEITPRNGDLIDAIDQSHMPNHTILINGDRDRNRYFFL
jgi:hypothetical protein